MSEADTIPQPFVRCLHLPSDNRPLSATEYADIRRGLDAIARLHVDFRSFVAGRGLDPAIFLPGGLWAELYGFDTWEEWTCDLVNMIKALSPLFTGFDTLAFDRRENPGLNHAGLERLYAQLLSTGKVPADLELRLQREFQLFTRLWLSRYLAEAQRQLVRNVPSRYVVRCPDRMGEIGIIADGEIINPDLLTYQSRLNAMFAGGALARVEAAIAERGVANVLEIGPGLCFLPQALQRAFDGRLNVVLIDLPRMMARGYAYLAGVAGADRIGLVTKPGQPLPARPFVFVPNYLVPDTDAALPQFDLVYNAISLNEMNDVQVAFYLDLIDRHLAPQGVFVLEQGGRYRDGHQDAMAAARSRFPRHTCLEDAMIDGVSVMAYPNSFFYANMQPA